jgi:uncharacterized membrane protein YfcA
MGLLTSSVTTDGGCLVNHYWHNSKWYRAANRTGMTIAGFVIGAQFFSLLITKPLIVLAFFAVVYLIYSFYRNN